MNISIEFPTKKKGSLKMDVFKGFSAAHISLMWSYDVSFDSKSCYNIEN